MNMVRPMIRSIISSRLLGLSLVAVAGFATADELKNHAKGAEQALITAFKQRTQSKSCEPIAPIQTRIIAPSAGVIGGSINVRFEAMLMESDAQTEYRIDLPAGVRLVNGKGSENGSMIAKKGYGWNFQVIVDQPGDYEVTAQVVAGDDTYRYGQRRSVYIHSNGTQLKITTEKPKVKPVLQLEPMIAKQDNAYSLMLKRDVGAPPPIEGFKGKTDPYGTPLDKPAGGGLGIAATCTVEGTWRYRHTDTTLHAGYGSWVEAWDDDTAGADDFLARTTADSAGNFSLTFDNADDIGFGTADVYIVFRSENTRAMVHNSGAGSGYSTATGVLFPNIGSGTFNAGGWYADWGTNGVSDNNERSFQICDDLTTAWQHWNYAANINFDNRLTYCQWYLGSTDGSYYDRSQNRIYLEDSDVSSPDVTMHEYGHSMHDGLFSDTQWPPGTGGAHSFTGHYTTGLAWTEGFGTYYSCTAQGNDWIYNSYDPANLITFDCDANWDGNGSANGNSDGLSVNPNWGYDTESAVLSMMLDIDDTRNSATDAYDWSSLGDDEIFNSMRNYTTGGHRPYSIQEFFDGWHSIVDVQNPKINGQMQVHGMTQPINFPALGISDGVDGWAGTWYYGGYGRGSFDVKNYSSRNYNLNRLYVWLRGPGGEDIGQFGSDNDNTPIASGATRNIWITADQTGYNPAAPNFVLGAYTITAGHYRSDNAWQVLQPAESGATNQITKNVVTDPSAPTSCAVQDDGANQTSLTQIHITAQSSDNESSIDGYWTRVGSSAGLGNYQDWVFHKANNVTNWDYTITGLAIPNGAIAYVTVVSQNINSADSPFAYTDGIKCGDTTAPGTVTVTDDGLFAPRNDEIHYSASTTEPDGGIYLWWSRVGTSAGLGDVQDWVNYDIHTLTHNNTITGLSMPTGSRYYVTSVARNYGFMDTFGYSDGILTPLYPSTVTVVSGTNNGGNLASLQFNDANRYSVQCTAAAPFGNVEFSATCPVTTGSTMYLILDAAGTNTQMIRRIEMFNYTTGQWVAVDSRFVTTTDNQVTVSRPNANQYIQAGTKKVLARVKYLANGDAVNGSWTFTVDRVNWYVDP